MARSTIALALLGLLACAAVAQAENAETQKASDTSDVLPLQAAFVCVPNWQCSIGSEL